MYHFSPVCDACDIFYVTFVRLFGFFSQTVDMRDELALQDGLIFKANTVVIPRSLHADMKARVHSSHKAFDDLSAVAVKLKDKCICDGEWFSYCQEALKAGKQYIKTEYKVCLVVYARNLSKIFFFFRLRYYFSFQTGSYHTRIPRR